MAITNKNMVGDLAPQYTSRYLPAVQAIASVVSSVSLDGVTFGPGAAATTLNSRYYVFSLADASDSFILLPWNFPHNYVDDTSLIVTIFWTSTATSGNCRFNFGMTHVSSTGVYTQDSDTDINYAGINNYTAPTASQKIVRTVLNISGSGFKQGGATTLLLAREGINLSDTMAGPMYFIGAEIQYQINKPGS